MSTQKFVKRVKKLSSNVSTIPSTISQTVKKFSYQLPTNRVFQEFKVNMDPAEILSNTNDIIQFVWHLSDIHIRGYKEVIHEYKGVFLNLLDSMYTDIVRSHKIDNLDYLIDVVTQAKEIIVEDVQKVNEKIIPYCSDSLIIIAGDVLHNHTAFDDRGILLLRSWIRALTYLSNVIVLGGNHDYHLYEDGRQALSGLLDIDNTHVLLTSKNYVFNNIVINCFSLFDKGLPNVAEPICKNKINISLYHGQVNAVNCRPNTELKYECLPLETFNCTSHFGFFGDRHSHEYLDKERRYAYPSNLVQIHRKEHVSNHGYMYWNVISGKSKYVRVKNVLGRVNFTFVNNEIINKPELADENIVYCKCINSDPTKCVPIMKEYIEKEGKNCIKVHIKNRVKSEEKIGIEYDNESETLASSECQIKLINQYVQQNPEQKSKEFIEDVLKIHNNLFEKIDKTPRVIQNKEFRIKRLFFHNIYSYGPNNMLDFEKLQDVVGVSGLNYAGKTNLFKTIIFSLFGTSERETAKPLINNESNGDLYTLIEIVQEGVIYAILRANAMAFKNPEKKFEKNSYTSMITELLVYDPETDEYSKFDETLSEAQTEKKIMEICGNKLNFHKLFFMLQNSKEMNFIDISHNIKDTFHYFSDHYDYHIFDSLWRISISIVEERQRELKLLQKTLKNKNNRIIESNIIKTNNELKQRESLMDDYKIKFEELGLIKSKLQLQSTVSYINDKFPEFATKSIEELEDMSLTLQNKISENSQMLEADLGTKEEIEQKIRDIEILRQENINIVNEKITQILESSSHSNVPILNMTDFESLILQKEISIIESKIKNSENILYSTKAKIDDLESGYINEYFTRIDATIQQLKDLISLSKNKKLGEELIKNITIANLVAENKNIFTKIVASEQKKLIQYCSQRDKLKQKQYDNFKNYFSKIQNDEAHKIEIITDLDKLIKQINTCDDEIKQLFIEQCRINYIYDEHNNINSYDTENFNIIQEVLRNIMTNQRIDIELQKLSEEEKKIIQINRENNAKIKILNNDKISLEKDLKRRDDDAERCEILEDEIEKYRYYKNMVCPNGIPKLILKNIVHKTETICNQILNIFSDMSINFQIKDGSPDTTKDHEAYPHVKIYTMHRIPLDLSDASSGFQSFILNFAIKASIIKLFNIKSIGFLVLDEFLSVLDLYKVDQLDEFFNYIKRQYNTIFIISHNEAITKYYRKEIKIMQSEKASSLIDNFQIVDQISSHIKDIVRKFVIASKNQKKEESDASSVGNRIHEQVEDRQKKKEIKFSGVCKMKKTPMQTKIKPKVPQQPLVVSVTRNEQGLFIVNPIIDNNKSSDTNKCDNVETDKNNNSSASTCNGSESNSKTNSESNIKKRPRKKKCNTVIDISKIDPVVSKMKEKSATLEHINKRPEPDLE